MTRVYARKLMELSSFNKEWTEAFTSCIPYGYPSLTRREFDKLTHDFMKHHNEYADDEWAVFVEDVGTFYKAIDED